MSSKNIVGQIEKLKNEKNAVILAHNYQVAEVQDIADFVGDSFGLSRKAAETDAEIIVFCGVKFMAESAKILSPEKTVLLPEKMAGCPMAAMVDAKSLRKKKREYPDAAVVTYVNSTAEVKAESDICCTSANAVDIVNALDNKQVLFVPDKNLGSYVADRTDKEIILWDGYCSTHYRVEADEVDKVRAKYPEAPILVHPECRPEVVEKADFTGSTAGILKFAQESEAEVLIIGTEEGLIHRLKKENPDKTFFLLSQKLICPNMKKTNIDKVLNSLKNMETKVEIEESVRRKAYQALDRMLKLG